MGPRGGRADHPNGCGARARRRGRAVERAEIARLSAIVQAVPLAALADADLDAWAASLGRDRAALDRQLAAGPSAAGDLASSLGTAAGSIDPSLAPLASQIGAVPSRAAAANQGRPADAQQIEERRRELTQLLDAVSARATGALASRAADLRKRLADLKADTTAATTVDASAFGDRLTAVSAAVNEVEAAAGPSLVVEIRSLRDQVYQQLTGGVDEATRATQSRQLLALLDGLSARGNPALRARVAELRAAVLSPPDGEGDLRAPGTESAAARARHARAHAAS